MGIAKTYWDGLYNELLDGCIRRNTNLTKDFIKNLEKHPSIYYEVKKAKSIIEMGCGTGQMGVALQAISEGYYEGYDISTPAIEYAVNNFASDSIKFSDNNILDVNPGKHFDLSFSSNTLEHFKEPFVVVDRLLSFSDKLLLMLPYNEQDMRDGYDSEGGAGHVYAFTEDSFIDYMVHDWFTFFTHEWSQPPNPLQLVILISKE